MSDWINWSSSEGNSYVLQSCAKSPSVKRVVLTSSIATVLCNGRPASPEDVADETLFSDPDLCRESEVSATIQKWNWIIGS